MKLLLAEDNVDLNEVITRKLRVQGYEVDACYDGMEASLRLARADYDAAILDIMMPEKDGMEVLREIRGRHDHTPVIFLTARDAIADRVRGLESGANDYVVKPFSFEELNARIRAVTRAAGGFSEGDHLLTVEDLTLDTRDHSAARGGIPITLTAREYALLEYLMLHPGRILSRERIENRVWGYDYCGGTNVVDVYINYLRKKIDEGHERKLIRTVRGFGYMMQGEL